MKNFISIRLRLELEVERSCDSWDCELCLTWPRPRAVRSMHEAIVWVQPRTTTLAKKKNHHRDSRREERCSTCDIMLDQARSAQGKSDPRLSATFALRWSRLIEHDITRGTAFFSPRISRMVLFFGQGSRSTSHVTTGSVKPRSSDRAFNQTKGFQICTDSDTRPYLALAIKAPLSQQKILQRTSSSPWTFTPLFDWKPKEKEGFFFLLKQAAPRGREQDVC